jgi:bifunctional enzyme CysN/CysC
VAINKMDLVDYDQDTYETIAAEYRAFAEKLDIKDLVFIPMSALRGDNVVTRSERMEWYTGTTLLHHLETVNVGADRNLVDFRFPVQYVIRPHQDYRGFAGRVGSGTITPGEEIVVLPSGRQSRIRSVDTADGAREEAMAGDSVVLTIEDEVDISRGDMIVRKMNVPTVSSRFDAMICWMSAQQLDPSTQYQLLHTTRQVQAFVTNLVYRIDVDTLHREEVETLGLNDVGRVEITTAAPIFFDPYQLNRTTGSFILIDPFTNVTVAAGMIRGEVKTADTVFGPTPDAATSPDVVWEEWNIERAEREARTGHRAAVVWLTGLSGSGKSTIARALERELFTAGCQTMLLDGDQLRHGLNGDLAFGENDRRENVRRAGEVARLFFEQGSIVLCTFVSPYAEDRDRVRRLLPEGRFLEVFVDCDLAELRRRDTKGLYARAAAGDVTNLTGISAPYMVPQSPDLVLETDKESVRTSVSRLLDLLRREGIIL